MIFLPIFITFTFSVDWGMGVKIVEILMRSNVVALVGGGLKPKWPQGTLVLWDDHGNRVKLKIFHYSLYFNQ